MFELLKSHSSLRLLALPVTRRAQGLQFRHRVSRICIDMVSMQPHRPAFPAPHRVAPFAMPDATSLTLPPSTILALPSKMLPVVRIPAGLVSSEQI